MQYILTIFILVTVATTAHGFRFRPGTDIHADYFPGDRCDANTIPFWSHPTDGSKFMSCVRGRYYVTECPSFYRWNSGLQQCVDPSAQQMPTPPTIPANSSSHSFGGSQPEYDMQSAELIAPEQLINSDETMVIDNGLDNVDIGVSEVEIAVDGTATADLVVDISQAEQQTENVIVTIEGEKEEKSPGKVEQPRINFVWNIAQHFSK